MTLTLDHAPVHSDNNDDVRSTPSFKSVAHDGSSLVDVNLFISGEEVARHVQTSQDLARLVSLNTPQLALLGKLLLYSTMSKILSSRETSHP